MHRCSAASSTFTEDMTSQRQYPHTTSIVLSAMIRVHKSICDTSVRESTDSYSVTSSDKWAESASVQEANITATVNGMQRYLELPIREGERKKNDLVPFKG